MYCCSVGYFPLCSTLCATLSQRTGLFKSLLFSKLLFNGEKIIFEPLLSSAICKSSRCSTKMFFKGATTIKIIKINVLKGNFNSSNGTYFKWVHLWGRLRSRCALIPVQGWCFAPVHLKEWKYVALVFANRHEWWMKNDLSFQAKPVYALLNTCPFDLCKTMTWITTMYTTASW